jgi:hypothetical protein
MNDQMQQQLASYLKEFVETVKAGGEFALTQAPLIVQEKVLFGRVMSTGLLMVCLVAAIVLIRYARSNYAMAAQAKADDGRPYWEFTAYRGGVLAVVCSIAGAACCLAAIGFAHDTVQVWFAPRLYILEWAASLLK